MDTKLMKDRYDDLPKFSVKELEDEINFYDFLITNEGQLGGIESSHRIWYEALKIEINRRGLTMEKRIKLVKDNTSLINDLDNNETYKKIINIK